METERFSKIQKTWHPIQEPLVRNRNLAPQRSSPLSWELKMVPSSSPQEPPEPETFLARVVFAAVPG